MNSIKDFFDFINERCVYVVLRNWENIFNSSLYVEGHEDIDILCEDLQSFISLTKARRVHKNKYKDNYVIRIGEKDVRFDIRHIGDGYYPVNWEKDILKNRIIDQSGVYIMSKEDFVFSLSYHALLQKKTVSSDYLIKLQTAFWLYNQQNINNEGVFLSNLSDFCKNKTYYFEIPSDPGVIINWYNKRALLSKTNIWRLLRRVVFRTHDNFMRHFH